jgi:hypothetical protein
MFNFRSLAEVVGVTLEGENAGRRLSRIEVDKKTAEEESATSQDSGKAEEQQVEQAKSSGPAASDEPVHDASRLPPPELMITPETPAALDHSEGFSKQLGVSGVEIISTAALTTTPADLATQEAHEATQ